MRRFGTVLAAALVLTLTGCDGGGGDPGECSGSPEVCAGIQDPGGSPSNPTGPIGLYKGSTGTGRVLYAVVREPGGLWFLYSQLGNGALLQGAEQGSYAFSAGTITSNDLADFTSEVQGVTRGVFSGTAAPGASLAGTVTLTDRTFTFSAAYDRDSTTSPAVGAASGTYDGVAVFAGDQVTASATVTNDGVIAGTTAGGCNFNGNLIPEPGLKTYSLTLTFLGATCPANPALTATGGVAFVDGDRFYVGTINTAKTQGFAFSGGRR